MAELSIVPALVMGGLIGLVELFFVHADESGLGWLSHGLHTLPIAMFLTFVGMNLSLAFNIVGFSLEENFWVDLGARVLLGIIATVKVKGAAAIVSGKNAIGEKLIHALIVGALIAASPYIWVYLAPYIPTYLGGAAQAAK